MEVQMIRSQMKQNKQKNWTSMGSFVMGSVLCPFHRFCIEWRWYFFFQWKNNGKLKVEQRKCRGNVKGKCERYHLLLYSPFRVECTKWKGGRYSSRRRSLTTCFMDSFCSVCTCTSADIHLIRKKEKIGRESSGAGKKGWMKEEQLG